MAIIRAVPKKRLAAAPPQLGARLAPGRYQMVAAPSASFRGSRVAMPTVMLRRVGGNYYTG